MKTLPNNGSIPNVDSGMKSRKLWIGVIFGLIMIAAATFLQFAAGTGMWNVKLGGAAAQYVAWMTPKWWVVGCGVGMLFTAVCLGLISMDKILTFAYSVVPLAKDWIALKLKSGGGAK